MKDMYPSCIVLVMAKQQSIFGGATFIICSDGNNPAAHNPSQQQASALSTLLFASAQENADQRVASLQVNSIPVWSVVIKFIEDGFKSAYYIPDRCIEIVA